MISAPARRAVVETVASAVLAVARQDRVTLVAVDGQAIYVRECDPRGAATIVVDNTDLAGPKMVRSSSRMPGG